MLPANRQTKRTEMFKEKEMGAEKNHNVEFHTTKCQKIFFSWAKDILIYVIVLNLFVEYNPLMTIDSFTLSIFTAILLKILLELILTLEHKVADVFKNRKGLKVFFIWLILFGSKFLILEVINFVFGEHVQLGKFWDIFFLALTLLLARQAFLWIYQRLGKNTSTSQKVAG
jgi:hypothetical protein